MKHILAAAVQAQPSFPVRIDVDASQAVGELKPIWRFFGADEPNVATMKDGRKLMQRLGELRPGSVYFRTHNLLNTGDGRALGSWRGLAVHNAAAMTLKDRIDRRFIARFGRLAPPTAP